MKGNGPYKGKGGPPGMWYHYEPGMKGQGGGKSKGKGAGTQMPQGTVEPAKLEWTGVKIGERQSQRLKLHNPSPDRDAFYKIQLTHVARYAVLPGQALIPAGNTAEVEIVLIKMDELPTSTDLKDRFLIQAAWKDDPA